MPDFIQLDNENAYVNTYIKKSIWVYLEKLKLIVDLVCV